LVYVKNLGCYRHPSQGGGPNRVNFEPISGSRTISDIPYASKRASFIKKIHEKTKEAIEKRSKYYAAWANKHPKKVTFEPGDLVWVHLYKDRFP
jgi:hypothetical protein